jgi:hypothetical protein
MAGVVDIDAGADSWLPVPIAPPQIRRGRLANAGKARLRPQAKLKNVAETGRHKAAADMCHLAFAFVHMFVGCDIQTRLQPIVRRLFHPACSCNSDPLL